MKILIDIKHPAQLNLFKKLSRELQEEDWDVTISYLQRGKLPAIIDTEYAAFDRIPIGTSNGTKWSILWHGNLKRTINFLGLIRKNKYDICIAASSIPLALACKISGTPVIQFYDDPERKRVNYLNAKLSNQIFFPPIVESNAKISIFNCLKEWSYLSPRHFLPDARTLEPYGLLPHSYIFIREVSNKSFNYYNQQDAIVCSCSNEIDAKTKVVLSLEDKTIAGKFPKHWIILKEPVADIHSLIYYSTLVVSSGDSMAREGAMLGVPSIYCGVREMKANQLLMEMGILKHFPGIEMIAPVNEMTQDPFNKSAQDKIRHQLVEKWDDMNAFMMKQIDRYRKVQIQ
jgi:predicted glycosyltransferase